MTWLRKLLGGGKGNEPVQKESGYLASSDLQEDQSIVLKIKYTHLPRTDVEDAWREISFWEIRARMIVTPAIRQTLLDAYGEDWIGRKVYVCKIESEPEGPPTYGLQVLPVKEDMGKTHVCGRCGYRGGIEEISAPPGVYVGQCINWEHCMARDMERMEKIADRSRRSGWPLSDPRYRPHRGRRPARR